MRHSFQHPSFSKRSFDNNSLGPCPSYTHNHFCDSHLLCKYAYTTPHQTYRVPLPPPPSPSVSLTKLRLQQTHSSQPMVPPQSRVSSLDAPNAVRSAHSFHATTKRATDPRKTRTIRCNTSPTTKLLALQLSTTPVVTVLLLPEKTPSNSLVTAHTAATPHAHWRVLATSVPLPTCITLPCHASELDTRLIRVHVFTGRRGVGDFVIPVRTVLGLPARVAVSKRSSLDVRAVVGTYTGCSIAVGLCAGMSIFKEVRGCVVRVKRVGGGREDVPLGQWEFDREGYCRVNILGEVVWFGIEQGDGTVVRLVFQIVKKGRFAGEQVVGEMQIGMDELGKVGEGQVFKVAWWRGGVTVVLLAIVEVTRQSAGQVLLELRVTR